MNTSFFALTLPSLSAGSILKRSGLGAVVCLALLSGCAQVTSVKPGTPVRDVLTKYGKPAVSCILKDGSKRVVYTAQPSGEQAWASAITPEGKIVGFEQVLTDAQFSVLGTGNWTADAVRCQFGPPAEVETLGSGNNQRTVWSYHYMQNQSYYGLMNINFDVDTHKMINFQAMTDPTRDPTVRGFSE